MDKKKIFNITRFTYINSGHVSDFFREYCKVYAVYSINSHHTKYGDKSFLRIYRDGTLESQIDFLTLPLNPPAYLSPLYQVINIINIIIAFFLLRFRFKIIPDLTVSSFCLWGLTARFMQIIGFTKKTLFWSWDFFPRIKESPYYWLLTFLGLFESLVINTSDYSWYASRSNFDRRVSEGQVKNRKDNKHKIVHWGMGGEVRKVIESNFTKTGILKLIYFGSIDFEKGLDLVFDSLADIYEMTEGRFELLIIGGDTPYKHELINRIPEKCKKNVKFKDFMSLDEFGAYAKSSDLGIATYVPEIGGEPNFTYYADPAKPRDYLTYGLPMLITKVPYIYKDIEEYHAGLVLDKYNKKSLMVAVKAYMENPEFYRQGAFEIVKKDRYDIYYKSHFDEILN